MSRQIDIERVASDHWDERRGGARPGFIILHYSDTRDFREAADYFTGVQVHPSGGRVSAHYMIDRDGRVEQYVDEDQRAWHAGRSYWAGTEDLNSHSIGIELFNPGRRFGYQPFPVQQVAVLVDLCREIMARHSISPYRVLGHSDVAPSRKSDPGELFDWKLLARAGCAVWPEPNEEDRRIGSDYVRDQALLREAFIRAGYDPAASLDDLVLAFQRHYQPEIFGDQDKDRIGNINETMTARLHWLVRTRPHL